MNDSDLPKASPLATVSGDLPSRIIAKRRRDCELLGKRVVSELVELGWTECEKAPTNVNDPIDQMEWLLKDYLKESQNEHLVASYRRERLTKLRDLLQQIDAKVRQTRERAQSGSNSVASSRTHSDPQSLSLRKQPTPNAATCGGRRECLECGKLGHYTCDCPELKQKRNQKQRAAEHKTPSELTRALNGSNNQKNSNLNDPPNETAKKNKLAVSRDISPLDGLQQLQKDTSGFDSRSASRVAPPSTRLCSRTDQSISQIASRKNAVNSNGSKTFAETNREAQAGEKMTDRGTSCASSQQQQKQPLTLHLDTSRAMRVTGRAKPAVADGSSVDPSNRRFGPGSARYVPLSNSAASVGHSNKEAKEPRGRRVAIDDSTTCQQQLIPKPVPNPGSNSSATVNAGGPLVICPPMRRDTREDDRALSSGCQSAAEGSQQTSHARRRLTEGNQTRMCSQGRSGAEPRGQHPQGSRSNEPSEGLRGKAELTRKQNRSTPGLPAELEKQSSIASRAGKRSGRDPSREKPPHAGNHPNPSRGKTTEWPNPPNGVRTRSGQAKAALTETVGKRPSSSNERNARRSEVASVKGPSAGYSEDALLPGMAQFIKRRATFGPRVSLKIADDKIPSFACALEPRQGFMLFLNQIPATVPMGQQFSVRFETWEPFWRTLRVLNVGVTCPPANAPTYPEAARTAAHIEAFLGDCKEIPSSRWGVMGTTRDDGERSLLLTSFPFASKSRKRADCHLWPKGTFVQVGGKPVHLFQRKQQSHDSRLWKGMCKPLDLTQHIKTPRQSNIGMCCYDEERYIYCLSVCEYRSVENLFQILMRDSQKMEKLSREESIEKAMSFVQNQMVVLGSDDENSEQAVGKFIFTLTCPISKCLIKTPVRGRSCKHWQCFDLRSFLTFSETVCGGRWRCASCENFLSWTDLQLCGLTSDIIKEHEGIASPQRDRIEFCSDRTYHLLPEAKSRYDRKRPNPDPAVSLPSAATRQRRAPPSEQSGKSSDDAIVL